MPGTAVARMIVEISFMVAMVMVLRLVVKVGIVVVVVG